MTRAARVTIIALTIIIASCASTADVQWTKRAGEIGNVDEASRYYVMASRVYKATMDSLVALRKQRRISDETWTQIERYRDAVGVNAQKAGVALELWRKGAGRGSFDVPWDQLITDLLTLQQLHAEVK